MKVLVLAFILITPLAAVADSAAVPPSPAERRIDAAQISLRKQPDRFQAYNDLTLALISRARETGDAGYYRQAEESVAKSLQIQPNNFEGERAQVALLLAECKYQEALEKAKALNHRSPDAVPVWGELAEANAGLGDYDEAEKAAQWMMDLRPGNTGAFVTGAALREDWGDLDGAADFLSKALQQTPPFETEQTAWLLTALARLNRTTGKLEAADSFLGQALTAFPGYYLAIEELARLRMAQHRDTEAVELIRKRNHSFPSAGSLYLGAEAVDRAGNKQQADTAFRDFEKAARALVDQPANANRELILYYAGRGRQPAEALRIARLDTGRRHDVWTLDAYAWALYSSGQFAEARRQIDKALEVGARESVLLYHAGAIAESLGDKEAANRYLTQSLDLDPASDVVRRDQQALSRLAKVDVAR